jgi:hypothetical protein
MHMTSVQHYWDFARTMVELQLNLLGVDTRSERGAVSTEMAVVIAAMVAIAAVAAIAFMASTREAANKISIPDPPG